MPSLLIGTITIFGSTQELGWNLDHDDASLNTDEQKDKDLSSSSRQNPQFFATQGRIRKSPAEESIFVAQMKL